MISRRKFVVGAAVTGGALAAGPLVWFLSNDGERARPIAFRISHDPSVHVTMGRGEAFDITVYRNGEVV